jgi:hypothetical protein
MVVQDNWRWCHFCHGLFFAGTANQGACPANPQGHGSQPSGNYVLINSLSAVGQHGWRRCSNCGILFFGRSTAIGGVCPGRFGPHDGTQGEDYTLFNNDPAAFGQPDWRWCHKCDGLFFEQSTAIGGVCPSGGQQQHDGTQSGEYKLMHYKD